MCNTIEAIHLLEDKLQSLLSNYEFLKNENEILLQSTNKLQHQLIESQRLLAEQQKEYDLLKIAKTIDGSSTNTRDTKLKINTLIREIDKCIIELHK
ncbi:hypothetical protein [Polaribacter butkevichii]|uniref:Uncharacterized protein n=1 Tax=Polaribacter butkevichii TaxID=218490 RepID=A0A2P6CC36_9FLAO|nr:hypothetical protein [Polaribacter butkevichii]PQJ72475.1 hypothetical protein BTO14_04070 [Polaribacter butkevichii]